jgi:A/G-specific adenine glycosylase
VVPYYERFFRSFPSLRSLGRARSEAVLRAWAGLGYYSRARNLHRAAKTILQKHQGRFPRELDAALALPGVGPYIARAVLSIAYDQPHAVLDGNVARVIVRREAIEGDPREPAKWRSLQAIADGWLARRSPGDWNQAMMELGATVCTPRQPRCPACPVREGCRAFRLGIAGRLPGRRAKARTVSLRIAAAVLLDPRGRTLLIRFARQGRANGLLASGELAPIFSRLWQFPACGADGDSGQALRNYLANEFGIRDGFWQALGALRHTVTYREITIEPWLVHVERLPAGAGSQSVSLDRVPRMAISGASRKISLAAIEKMRLGDGASS